MGERIVVIGNGMASVRFVETLLRLAPGRFDITVVGEEPQAGYNRVLLSAVLAGDADEAETVLRPRGWYAANGVTLITGVRAQAILPARHAVRIADGRALGYDRLVLATGSQAARLDVPGADLPGVVTFRDFSDLAAIRARAVSGRPAVVIGGGLLGIEAAYGLKECGMAVTLVHSSERLMGRQLDARAAAHLRNALVRKGIGLKLSAATARIGGDGAATHVDFGDGSRLDAGLVVMAVGVRPNAGIAATAGLKTVRGIVVDDSLTTSDPDIHAIGECAEHRGIVQGLVEPSYEQAAVLAARLSGDGAAVYAGSVQYTNLKVSGIGVFSAGDFEGAPGTDSTVFEDHAAGIYRKLVFSGPRLAGAVLVGDTGDALWYRDLIRSGLDISAARSDLVFGRRIAGRKLPEAA